MLSSNGLLQCNAKPYLAFQNLGYHCKISGCHFDIQKRLKKTLGTGKTERQSVLLKLQ